MVLLDASKPGLEIKFTNSVFNKLTGARQKEVFFVFTNTVLQTEQEQARMNGIGRELSVVQSTEPVILEIAYTSRNGPAQPFAT